MNQPLDENIIDKITSIIHNQPLALAIHESITSALKCPFLLLPIRHNAWDIFKRSLDAAIRDIENHPRGKLFRRLIEYGPHHPDDPKSLTSDEEGVLSDPECGTCVEFIFSHMVNRFKGELAELLAIEPCIDLVDQLLLPNDIKLYLGDTIQERNRINTVTEGSISRWGNFTKGADGLIAADSKNKLIIHGVIEVKSMTLSLKKTITQIERHILRLNGGVKLGERIWTPDQINYSNVHRIIVVPSTWKLSREWHSVETDQGRTLAFPEPTEPAISTELERLQPDVWRIKLAWSQEALEQAAYEMTFWYMSQVGKHIYSRKNLPKGWEDMTPEEAGYNAIKMMLYYMPLRYLSQRQMRRALKLYNVYSFGYPLGVDSKEMLWPEDFPGE